MSRRELRREGDGGAGAADCHDEGCVMGGDILNAGRGACSLITRTQQGGTGEGGHLPLARRTLGAATIEKKKITRTQKSSNN